MSSLYADANPQIESLPAPISPELASAPEVRWPRGADEDAAHATIRTGGENADGETFVVYNRADPALVKDIVERWIEKGSFVY